jgi:PAS domain S-box-containing protein
MTDYQENLEKILDLLRENPRGLNIREIAELIGASRISAAKYLDVLAAEGKIEVRAMGKAKIFYVIQISTPPSLLNRIPSMILVLGADARVIQANDHFLKHCSLSQKQVFGQPLDAIPRGVTRKPAFLTALAEVFRTRTPLVDLTVDALEEDKKFRITIKPTAAAGDRFGVIVIITEIPVQRGSVPDKSLPTIDQVQVLLEDIGVPVCIVQVGKIVTMNARFSALTGCDREALVSRPFTAFVHPENRDVAQAFLTGLVQERSLEAAGPFRCITKTGSDLLTEAQAVPFSWKKEPAFLIFCIARTGQSDGNGAQPAGPERSG